MKEVFNRIYSDLRDKNASWSNFSEIEFKASFLGPLISEKKVILLGCGDFSLGFLLAPSVRQISGLDFSEVAIDYAKKNVNFDSSRISLQVQDLKNELHGPHEKWGVVVDDYLSHCLVDCRDIFFKNVVSLMRPSGVFVTFALTWPEGFSWPPGIAETLDPITKTQTINGVNGRILKAPEDLLSEISSSGLVTLHSEVVINPTGQPVLFSINKKKDVG